MSWRIRMVGMSVLLCGLAGCLGQLLSGSLNPIAHKQIVAAPFGEVAAMLETGLSDNGVSVLSKRLDGEVRLAGRTKAGNVFCLYVKRQKAEVAENTVVSIRWDRDPDEAFWNTVVAILTAPMDDDGGKSS